MKAAIVESPGVLRVREIEHPTPGDYAVVCEILYGSICSGTDTHIVDGVFPYPVTYPTILGHESIGRVVEVGPKVRNLRIGALVTRVGCPAQGEINSTWGGFSEFGLGYDWRAMQADGLEVNGSLTINEVLPADFDPAAATMFITWRETFSYLSRLGVKSGDNVLIIGTGGNGLAFVAHARNMGATPIVIGSTSRTNASFEAGAAQLFDYKAPNLAELLREAFPIGFDVAVDAVGRTGGLNLALSQLKAGGILGEYGIDDMGKNHINPMYARGSFTFYNGGYDEQEAHEAIIGFVRNGQLDAGIWLDLQNPFPLEEINRAFDHVRNRSALKALIKIRG